MLDTIRSLCEKRGISLKALEQALHFSENSIFRWGKHSPSIDKVEAVADYFKVSVDYLLGRTDVRSLDPSKQDPWEQRLIETGRRLNSEGKIKLMDYAQDLLSSGRYSASRDAYKDLFEEDTPQNARQAG